MSEQARGETLEFQPEVHLLLREADLILTDDFDLHSWRVEILFLPDSRGFHDCFFIARRLYLRVGHGGVRSDRFIQRLYGSAEMELWCRMVITMVAYQNTSVEHYE